MILLFKVLGKFNLRYMKSNSQNKLLKIELKEIENCKQFKTISLGYFINFKIMIQKLSVNVLRVLYKVEQWSLRNNWDSIYIRF